jgi:hypothetical protein
MQSIAIMRITHVTHGVQQQQQQSHQNNNQHQQLHRNPTIIMSSSCHHHHCRLCPCCWLSDELSLLLSFAFDAACWCLRHSLKAFFNNKRKHVLRRHSFSRPKFCLGIFTFCSCHQHLLLLWPQWQRQAWICSQSSFLIRPVDIHEKYSLLARASPSTYNYIYTWCYNAHPCNSFKLLVHDFTLH